MTTKDAIKMLPIDEVMKIQILNTYDYLEPDQKLTISRLAWKTYFFFYELAVTENKEALWDKILDGKAKLDGNFYQDVLKQTGEKMTHKLDKVAQSTDLTAARQAVQQIIDEIHASKKAKKTVKH